MSIKEGWSPVGTAAQAQAGRHRARESRLKAARERRLRLDPSQLAREQRIEEAAVDVEVAWEQRTAAEHAVTDAEAIAAEAIQRLLEDRLAVNDVAQLTGLSRATVRRLRQHATDANDATDGVGALGREAALRRDAPGPV